MSLIYWNTKMSTSTVGKLRLKVFTLTWPRPDWSLAEVFNEFIKTSHCNEKKANSKTTKFNLRVRAFLQSVSAGGMIFRYFQHFYTENSLDDHCWFYELKLLKIIKRVTIEVSKVKESPELRFYVQYCDSSRNTYYHKVAMHLTNSCGTVWKVSPILSI